MKYDHRKIEKFWQKKWLAEGIYEPDFNKARRHFYNLMMFPYPSAEGLHVGNMYAFVGSDIYGRMKRMQGYDVFEPIGLDGFGIHAENYALKIKKNPAEQAKISEKNFYRQLAEIGNGFAWSERLETYDPAYYRWTQWIFVEMWKRGLAYRKKQAVNWCPSCKTVLADEQVAAGGCERCASKIIKRELEQWFFRITKYAEKLLTGLEKLDWSEKVKIAQRNWIGKSEGAVIKFEVRNVRTDRTPDKRSDRTSNMHVEVFTTRVDTIFGATFLALSPENPIVTALEFETKNHDAVLRYVKRAIKRIAQERKNPSAPSPGRRKGGIELKGVKAMNPATKKEIPVWVADYVLMDYGTGAIMGVPAHDERDFEFAKKYKLPIRKVIRPTILHLPKSLSVRGMPERLEIKGEVWEGEGELVDSGHFSGMRSERARRDITRFIGGKKKILYRLHDWIISRQRYWGSPIPMIFCPHCAREKKGERKDMPGWYAVPEEKLPVKLPRVTDFRPKGEGVSPLAKVPKFYNVKCPKCKREAVRETDVSDTFLDSAWYYIGYLAKHQAPSTKRFAQPFSNPLVRKWLPVDMYIGGAEHSVLHLLYFRFLAKAFRDWKLTDFDEPAKKFRAHGLLIREGAKMSKSKGNIVNPDRFIREFGADAFRMHLMFLGPFEDGGDFRDQGIMGPARFLERVWSRFSRMKEASGTFKRVKESADVESAVWDMLLHRAIKKITEDIENLRYNTAVSSLMVLLNGMESCRVADATFLRLLAPFAPHMAEELWRNVLGRKTSIHREPWPAYDAAKIQEETFTLVIQINGKVRDTTELPAHLSEDEIKRRALAREKILNALRGAVPGRIVYVPRRLINIVLP